MPLKKRDPNKKPKKGVYILPNAITLCGMFAGFFSIMSSINGDFLYAAWAILIATIFDGLDGWMARLTNTSSRFGMELDSLSDLVAFGLAPAIMFYKWALYPFGQFAWAAAFIFMACGALRLARFNVQTETATSKAFKGMPIPGAATILCSIVIFHYHVSTGIAEINVFYPIIAIVLALLMVSTLRYHGLKEVNLKEKKPFWVLVLFVGILFVMLSYPQTSIFVFSMSYLVWGLIENAYLVITRFRMKRELKKTEKAPSVK